MAYKYYNQNDYPEIPYGDGSIETSVQHTSFSFIFVFKLYDI